MPKGTTMANENLNSDDAGAAGDDVSTETEKPKKDPHFERAIKDRDAAKAKLREREAKLAEYEAKMADIESAKEAAAREDEQKRNDFAAQAQRWQKDLEAREKRAVEAEARLAAKERAERTTALVDAVAAKTSVSRVQLKGLLLVAAESGFDIAPEQLDSDKVAEAITKLRELEPDMFKSRSSGAGGTPGVNPKNKASSEDPNEDPKRANARAAAQALSPLQRRTPKD
jgi:hypothetical protein